MINNSNRGKKEDNNHSGDNKQLQCLHINIVKSEVKIIDIHSQIRKFSGHGLGVSEVVGGVSNLAESNATTGGDSVHILTILIPVSGVNRMCTYIRTYYVLSEYPPNFTIQHKFLSTNIIYVEGPMTIQLIHHILGELIVAD